MPQIFGHKNGPPMAMAKRESMMIKYSEPTIKYDATITTHFIIEKRRRKYLCHYEWVEEHDIDGKAHSLEAGSSISAIVGYRKTNVWKPITKT